MVDILALSRQPGVTEEEVLEAAADVAGNWEAAAMFMDRPHQLLRGRTPRQAVQEGKGQSVLGILLNVAGL